MRDLRVSIWRLAVGSIVLWGAMSVACSEGAVDEPDASPQASSLPPPLAGDGVGGPGGEPGGGEPGGGEPGGGGGRPGGVAEEICDGVDNDGDGRVDEGGCPCGPDPTCFAGPAAARGVGACRDGTRACDAFGEFYGPCEGSIGPAPEVCGDGIDNDCDGHVDECCDGPCDDDGHLDGGGPGGADGGPLGYDAGGPGGDEERFIVGESRLERPVDFVMVIDNSGSMRDTVAQVEDNLGTFSNRLFDAGIEYRFAMISEKGTRAQDPDVCVPPPMAAPACGDTVRFVHRDQKIGSNNGFERLLECWDLCDSGAPGIRNFLRPESLLQIIMVTDDESDLDWPAFAAEVRAHGFPDFVLNGVVGLMRGGCVAGVGDDYIRGARETGGALLDVCSNDWGQVLDVIVDTITVQLDRTFTLQGRPDPATIQVFIAEAGGAPVEQHANWAYEAAANAIVFNEAAPLPLGAQVIIRYQPR